MARDGASAERRRVFAALTLALALAPAAVLAPPAQAQSESEAGVAPGAPGEAEAEPPARAGDARMRTGLPLPRFASLRASEVFMRAGPGTRYPVEWIYRRRGLPVQIVAEFDAWRKVRDWNGTVGWVHRAMLTGRRMAITVADDTVLRRAPQAEAPALARAEPGVVARILSCEGPWCRIEAGGIRGWAARAAIWGTLPGEKVD